LEIRFLFFLLLTGPLLAQAQQKQFVKLTKAKNEKRVDIQIGQNVFSSFLYPDSLEKPVLFPIYDAGGTLITRGFPMEPRPGEPTDHPHHLGLWFTYENVNGLDFWNNSYAIPVEKKSQYGWIKTDSILELTSGIIGILRYHAKWVNQQNQPLLEELTTYEFSGPTNKERIIDRITELTADRDVLFEDAKDGMLGLRLSRELQIPRKQEEHFTDNKGNITDVKKDTVSNGNYLTSEGKRGDSAWGTRANWCKVFGKINDDSVSVTIFDHTGNPNYPTYWHARGYGIFAANPLGEKVFTNGKSAFNLQLKKTMKIIFRYRILIQNGNLTPALNYLDQMAKAFDKSIE